MPYLDEELALEGTVERAAPAPVSIRHRIQVAATMLRISQNTLKNYEKESGIQVPRSETGSVAVREYSPEVLFELAAWRRERGLTSALPRPVTLAIHNRKGGVGKTFLAVELATQWQLMGLRTLIIDADSQANTTLQFGYDPEIEEDVDGQEGVPYTLANLLKIPPYEKMAQPLDAVLKKPYGPHGPHLIPADSNISDLEQALISVSARDYRLDHLIRRGRKEPTADLDLRGYDIILIDLPPSITALVMASLVASDFWLVPLGLDRFGLKGLGNLIRSLTEFQSAFGRLPELCLIPNHYNRNRARSRFFLRSLKQIHGNLLTRVILRESEIVPRKMAASPTPVSLSSPMEDIVKEDLADLAQEILDRLAKLPPKND
ncbi:hypothetical protein A6M27_17055 [Acidithiobacillus thiooxidans]|uniref:AAA family ATPase n=3 Tax=Acidithiobacillus thiooxidans TaxID=930 RepID=UPI00046402A3|nr:AAA family ATPase [Acidithiobacillus thiooxidans]OCX83459.1 hypothetical protein A6O26_06945 [Acidithiobacillus thiooxidans]OCX83803.1 hypothetical protein A6M27_17055 [Acidithiobacillus thiooxidans]OFC50289.1 hypothetical protein BAE47_03040 [Acidithiobacillus thiooxidans]